MPLHFCQTLMEEVWASCCMLVAAHGEVAKKKTKTLPQEVRYVVSRRYVHEWKCIPVDRPYEGDLAHSP